MAVIVVDVLTETATVNDESSGYTVVDVLRTTDAPIGTVTGAAVIDVVSKPVVANAVVSATPPAAPYEGMVWIDIG